MTSTPVSELTERARDVFRMVVEAYLGSRRSRSARGPSRSCLGLNLSPASIRNVMQDLEELGPARRTAHLGRPDADRERPAPVRRRHHAGRPSRAPRSAPRSRRGSTAAARSRRRSATPPRRLSGLSACAGIVLVPKRGAGAAPARLRASSRRARRWRWWSAATAASRTGWSTCRRASPPRRSPRSAIMSARASPA